MLQICNTEEEKGKILDFLKPGCSQQCDVTCHNLGGTEAMEVGQIPGFDCTYFMQNLVAWCRSLVVFIFNLPPHQLCSAFSTLLPGCRSPKTPSTLQFSIESNLSIHDTHPVPGCLSLPGDVYAAIVEEHETLNSLSHAVDNNTSNMREKSEIPPVICADHAVFTCSIACKSQYLQQFAR